MPQPRAQIDGVATGGLQGERVPAHRTRTARQQCAARSKSTSVHSLHALLLLCCLAVSLRPAIRVSPPVVAVRSLPCRPCAPGPPACPPPLRTHRFLDFFVFTASCPSAILSRLNMRTMIKAKLFDLPLYGAAVG